MQSEFMHSERSTILNAKEEVKDAMKDLEISLDSDEFLVYRVGEYDYTFRFLDDSETVTGFDVMKLLKQPK